MLTIQRNYSTFYLVIYVTTKSLKHNQAKYTVYNSTILSSSVNLQYYIMHRVFFMLPSLNVSLHYKIVQADHFFFQRFLLLQNLNQFWTNTINDDSSLWIWLVLIQTQSRPWGPFLDFKLDIICKTLLKSTLCVYTNIAWSWKKSTLLKHFFFMRMISNLKYKCPHLYRHM